jgi:hypothetical protein
VRELDKGCSRVASIGPSRQAICLRRLARPMLEKRHRGVFSMSFDIPTLQEKTAGGVGQKNFRATNIDVESRQ